MTVWLWMGFRIAETAEVHSGYDIPYISPFKLMPGYAGLLNVGYAFI